MRHSLSYSFNRAVARKLNETYWKYDLASNKPPDVVLKAAEQFLKARKKRTFEEDYEEHAGAIGRGGFAKTVLCTHKATGAKRACKIVRRWDERREPDHRDRRKLVLREIAMLTQLEAHPAIVHLLDAYETDEHFYLVLELCSGGELFEAITKQKHFSEREAALKMHSIVDFLAYSHSKGIVHRDMKPENILLTEKGESAALKIIDFGTSAFCLPGQKLYHKVGTPYYVAPEVLGTGGHDCMVDVWAAGVIMYILLCGYAPFGGNSDQTILAKVRKGQFSMAGHEWTSISSEAKQCLKRMLVVDPTKRITAAELMESPWFRHADRLSNQALGNQVMSRLREFSVMSDLKRLALVVLARTFNDNDVRRLKEVFWEMDKDKEGTVDIEELRSALQQVGIPPPTPKELHNLFKSSAFRDQDRMDFVEFVASMLDSAQVARHVDIMQKTFAHFDTDNDGFITQEELSSMAKEKGFEYGASAVSSMMLEVDLNSDGRIDFQEFQSLFSGQGPASKSSISSPSSSLKQFVTIRTSLPRQSTASVE
ncbi:hypothetical protein WJX84_009183 [Apatococcus fuscideae]|uniref:Calmodulin n=1 Tax=Apatococcus fuscideae TaxID=2026836 RepID=A0AAW1RYL5_9CHLO